MIQNNIGIATARPSHCPYHDQGEETPSADPYRCPSILWPAPKLHGYAGADQNDDKGRLGSYIGCLDDDVMDYVDEALGISVGLHDLAGKEQKPYADESHDEMHGEMVLTLCGTCLRQFICSPEHIVRRINHAQAKEALYVLPRPGRLRLPYHSQEKTPGR